MLGKTTHHQVLILASAQALFQTVSVLVMTVGGLVGGQLAPSAQLATLPIAAMFFGTFFATFPASMWMARVGRRTGFVFGALLGVASGLIAAAGIWLGSFILLSFGTFLVGVYQAFAQFYRFAASEVANEEFRPRAIALVLAGGIVAAVAGPLLGRLGGPLFKPEYLGSFLLLSIVSLLAVGLLLNLRVPHSQTDTTGAGQGRPWQVIVGQPTYLVALFGAATGYGVMILGMTATPLAMVHHNHDLFSVSSAIQLHVLGMFLPSFFTGSLIGRFGAIRIMLAGVGVLGAYVFITSLGTSFKPFAIALPLLGVGWNFLYVGGTALLTTTYNAVEKGRAQAINDMSIFAVSLICSASAGVLLQEFGWQLLNRLLLPWLALAACALLWLGYRYRNEAADATN